LNQHHSNQQHHQSGPRRYSIAIVDGAIAYESPLPGEAYILLIWNALYIPSMDINLVPPFIMRAGGVIVNDTPKINCVEPTVDDHCISFPNHDLKIPMQLWGIFSYFHSRIPTAEEIEGCDKTFITPYSTAWNPRCESFESRRRLNNIMESEPDEYTDDYESIDTTIDNTFEADSTAIEGCPRSLPMPVF